jgi:5-methylcytosine-specific restriction endonuclease McrA
MPDNRRRDQRSPEAKGWQYLYTSAAWLRMREAQLAKDKGLCQPCRRMGKLVPANIVHHIEPHHGDEEKFYAGKLETVCADCHNGVLQKTESRKLSYSLAIDPATGFPLDPNHPANRG